WLKAKIKKVEDDKLVLDEEYKRLMGCLGVLQEYEAEEIRTTAAKNGGAEPSPKPISMIDAVRQVLKSSGKKVTVPYIEDQLGKTRKVSRGTVYNCLKRLKDRGVAVQHNTRLWGFVEGDDSTTIGLGSTVR
ncbi:MAG: hypothetical protein OXI92_02010, partial [Acidobacteriota bacterium]|nr:hypothetical protein [Acidobacteriota bacterium]